MTIAIGLLAEDAIIVAADSQTTRGNVKRDDAEKVSIIPFAEGSVIVAQAGNADRAGRAIDILTELALTAKITHGGAAVELAERAVLQSKMELKRQQGDCSMEELREFIWKHEQNFQLLIAHYFDRVPYFYVVDFVVGLANRDKRHFTAIGSASDLASYLLREYFKPGMEFNPTFATALYVIEEAKKHDSYCSGNTRLAFTSPGNPSHMMFQDLINKAAIEIKTFNDQTRDSRNQGLADMLQKVGEDWAIKRG